MLKDHVNQKRLAVVDRPREMRWSIRSRLDSVLAGCWKSNVQDRWLCLRFVSCREA